MKKFYSEFRTVPYAIRSINGIGGQNTFGVKLFHDQQKLVMKKFYSEYTTSQKHPSTYTSHDVTIAPNLHNSEHTYTGWRDEFGVKLFYSDTRGGGMNSE